MTEAFGHDLDVEAVGGGGWRGCGAGLSGREVTVLPSAVAEPGVNDSMLLVAYTTCGSRAGNSENGTKSPRAFPRGDHRRMAAAPLTLRDRTIPGNHRDGRSKSLRLPFP